MFAKLQLTLLQLAQIIKSGQRDGPDEGPATRLAKAGQGANPRLALREQR